MLFISSSPQAIFFGLQKQIPTLLTSIQKKVAAIALVIIGTLALVFAGYWFWKKKKAIQANPNNKNPLVPSPIIKDPLTPRASSSPPVTPTSKAPPPTSPFKKVQQLLSKQHSHEFVSRDSEQKKAKYENLKIQISLLTVDLINDGSLLYLDENEERDEPLLLRAILYLQDPIQRKEIVKLLIEKGVDPWSVGHDSKHDIDVDVLEEAVKTGDEELVDVIKTARVQFEKGSGKKDNASQNKVKDRSRDVKIHFTLDEIPDDESPKRLGNSVAPKIFTFDDNSNDAEHDIGVNPDEVDDEDIEFFAY